MINHLVPSEFYLGQNYPNPFKKTTIIKYCVADKTRVQITVYDAAGKEIEKLVDEEQQPGTYQVEFSTTQCHSLESRNLKDGYYYYKMTAGSYSSDKKWFCINNLFRSNKMKSFLQTLFLFLLVTQICEAQWYQQNSGTNKNLRDVVFLNATNGIAVGDNGIILITTDGGALWSVVPTNVYDDLTSVSFVDSENGWVGGGAYTDSSVILRTTDGGLNWYMQARHDLYVLNDIFFVDQNNGFIVGWQGGSGFNLYRTTDGGETWSGTTVQTNRILQKIYFLNQSTGWILGSDCGRILCNSVIYQTTDSGNSWQTQMEELGPELHDISFTDSQNGIAVGNLSPVQTFEGIIYQTTDGGESWLENLGPPFGEFDFVDVFHISNSVIAMWGTNWDLGDVFYWSTDSGVTWQLRDSMQFIYPIHINRIFFADTLNGWAVGNGGTILHTTNGGVSFVEEEEINEVPTEFLLSQNYPNPFNPSTKIKYSVPQSSNVMIKVFDILGKEIETLINEEKPIGTYEITWYAEGLPSGVYFYQLKAGDYMSVKKMILLK